MCWDEHRGPKRSRFGKPGFYEYTHYMLSTSTSDDSRLKTSSDSLHSSDIDGVMGIYPRDGLYSHECATLMSYMRTTEQCRARPKQMLAYSGGFVKRFFMR